MMIDMVGMDMRMGVFVFKVNLNEDEWFVMREKYGMQMEDMGNMNGMLYEDMQQQDIMLNNVMENMNIMY